MKKGTVEIRYRDQWDLFLSKHNEDGEQVQLFVNMWSKQYRVVVDKITTHHSYIIKLPWNYYKEK